MNNDFAQKVAIAKGHGYTSDEIKQYLAKTNAPMAMYDGSATPAKPKPGGLRGAAMNFLPTIAGGVGSVAGGALGSVVPGAGTFAGAAAGGALGSGLGEFLRQKLTGESEDGIDVGNIVQESAFGALPGAVKGVKAAKGAKAVAAGAKAADTTVDATKAAQTTEAAMQARKGIIKKTGEAMTRGGSGLKVGKNVGDINKLDEYSEVAAKYTGMPKTQLRKIDADMKKLSQGVDDILEKTPTRIDGTVVKKRLLSDDIIADERFADLDMQNPSVQTIVDRWSDKFAQATNAKEFNDVLKKVNKVATRAQHKLADPKAAPLTVQENAMLGLKRAGDDVLGEIPEIAPYKKQMAQLFEINPQTAVESERGFPVPFTNGGVKIKAPYQAVRGIQSRAGALMQGIDPAGGGFNPVAGMGMQTGKEIAKQGATRAFAAPFTGGFNAGSGPERIQTVDEIQPEVMEGEVEGASTETASTSPFDSANVEANVQKILASGGTMKDVTAYLSTAKAMQDLKPDGKKGLSSAAAGTIADTETGLTALRELQLEISGSGANNPLIGRIRGSNPLDSDAQDLKGSLALAKQIVGKALEGGVLRKEDELKYTRMLPTMGDTDTTAKNKINDLVTLISMRLNQYKDSIGVGSGPTDPSTYVTQ